VFEFEMTSSFRNDSPVKAHESESVMPLRESATNPAPVLGTGTLVAMGTFWSVLQTLATKVVTLVGQLVLAWILVPQEFGQIALAYTVTAFVSLLVNPGIDVILVRRGRRFGLWATPAFYFSMATGLVGSLVILATAPIVAHAYGVPQLKGLLTILAVACPLGSLLLVPTAKLRSEMRFKLLAAVNLFQSLLQMALTLAFAAAGFGVYSFVLPMPVVYLAVGAILWLTARPGVRAKHPFGHWRHLIGDSSYIFGQRLLLTIVQQGDYIILGALYGDFAVGPYFFAYGLATQAIRLTAGSLQLVLMAGLARMPAFSQQQAQAALRATKAIALFGMPLCAIQAAVAEPFLRAIYQDKWIAAVPLVQLISVGMAFDVASWPAGSLMQSRGQFRFMFLWSSVSAPTFIVAVLLGAFFAASVGVAVAVCLFFAITSPLLGFLAFQGSGIGGREMAETYLRPAFVSLISAGASLGAVRVSEVAGGQPPVQCVLAVGAGLVAMALSARAIMSSSWHDVVLKLRQIIARPAPLGQ
jgi:PST family polysaccharide transporter